MKIDLVLYLSAHENIGKRNLLLVRHIFLFSTIKLLALKTYRELFQHFSETRFYFSMSII